MITQSRHWCAAIALLLCLGAANSAEVRLDSTTRGALLALEPIANPMTAQALEDSVVIVSFFASWCPPCRTEFQHLTALKREFGDSLQIIAVNVFEAWDEFDDERLAQFLSDLEPTFSVVTGDEFVKQAFGDVDRIPTVFVFDKHGTSHMTFIHKRGAKKQTTDHSELRMAVNAAMNSPIPTDES